MTERRVLVAGLGDTGVLTAIRLARDFDVIGISTKPGLLSGQELGVRLARPEAWARDYWIPFERFRGLDRVRTIQGTLTGADLDRNSVTVRRPDGDDVTVGYDALVIATGVTNGFWRRPTIQTGSDIAGDLRAAHQRLAAADSVMVLGGGAAAVSSAANLAAVWPQKTVHLYFPGERALLQHHRRIWNTVRRRLVDSGVVLHPGHRAVVPERFGFDSITDQPVHWSTGQPPARADAVLWTIGAVTPNTDWLPASLLDAQGYVRVLPDLQVPETSGVFAIGDVAATDPLRSSARNRADKLLAHNVAAWFAEKPLRDYRPPKRKWGSVLGVQADGLEVFAPSGHRFRFPAWSIDRILQPWIVRRGIYRGIRGPTRS
ncbi:pyridine nucleotide-disulfide oxidoreductase [Mycobacterium sp. MS1601]|uniref:FAD-dependent oxidoreductase n=1 Tax=Mycobacterium sp. MS1601 TaxID=1936029 RepID=UPI0009797072|nr:FAD-dependent oxidoreductase [Mycobacterium sp. MS1601]AQA03382.1 pyridine nucleotide-disulfide oxidoreductase [Mycobacterium sp. MS1601]